MFIHSHIGDTLHSIIQDVANYNNMKRFNLLVSCYEYNFSINIQDEDNIILGVFSQGICGKEYTIDKYSEDIPVLDERRRTNRTVKKYRMEGINTIHCLKNKVESRITCRPSDYISVNVEEINENVLHGIVMKYRDFHGDLPSTNLYKNIGPFITKIKSKLEGLGFAIYRVVFAIRDAYIQSGDGNHMINIAFYGMCSGINIEIKGLFDLNMISDDFKFIEDDDRILDYEYDNSNIEVIDNHQYDKNSTTIECELISNLHPHNDNYIIIPSKKLIQEIANIIGYDATVETDAQSGITVSAVGRYQLDDIRNIVNNNREFVIYKVVRQ